MRGDARFWLAAASLCLNLWAAAVVAAERITEIRFIGNKVTRPETFLQEMTVEVGDPADGVEIERSRQAIMDLGLYKRVDATLLPAPDGKILQIAVEEKRYFLPIPRLNRNADGDISYGAQLRLDNLFGLNQQFKLTYEQTKVQDGTSDTVNEIAATYAYPRVRRTPYNVSVDARYSERAVEAIAEGYPGEFYDLTSQGVVITGSRFLRRRGPSRGYSVSAGVGYAYDKYRLPASLPPVRSDQERFYWHGGIGFADVRDYLYSREGVSYGYSLEFALEALGGNDDYSRHVFNFRRYDPISDKPHRNIDWQVQFGISEGVEEQRVFLLGSSSTLRGYPRDSIYGQAFLLANVEYLHPLFDRNELRGLAFIDVGNAYDRHAIDLTDMKHAVGVGLRYSIESFVKIQLRLDAGYAVDTGDYKIYAGTKDTF